MNRLRYISLIEGKHQAFHRTLPQAREAAKDAVKGNNGMAAQVIEIRRILIETITREVVLEEEAAKK